MPRFSISTGTVQSLTVKPDWPLNVIAADLNGNATVVLPALDNSAFNRPDKIHVVFFPGTPPVGISAQDLLAGGPSGVVDTPGAGVLGNDVPVSVAVPLPLPTGNVTVIAVGEFAS